MWPPQVSRLGQQHRFTSGLPSMHHFQFSAIKCILIHGFIWGYSHYLFINHVPTYINTTKKLLCDHLLLVQNIVMLQASSADSPSPATATVAKYLLKLWIQQRLEQVSGTWHDESWCVTCHDVSRVMCQIRSNQTSPGESPAPEATCPSKYVSDPDNSGLLCSLWAEYQVTKH